MPQYGFFFDQSRCVGCQNCSIACKSHNGIQPGPIRWARMFQWESGAFPDVRINTVFAPCYHCQNPVCVDAANGALIKEPKYGAVLIDPAKAGSPDVRAAWDACPYGAISFSSDAPDATASKCTMCVDRLEQGKLPVCVLSCPARALDFGLLSDLQAKYGNTSDLPGLPSSSAVAPAVVFKAKATKQQLVPYDSSAALQLLAKRGSTLPPVFSLPSDVTQIPEGMVGRGTLVMKAKSTSELISHTQDDNS